VMGDRKILLFDEPTESMDHSTEERIKARLRDYCRGKTTVIVTHRNSLLDLVDKVIVIDQGKIIAAGPKASVLEALNQGRIGKAA